jgi:uncharacterized protein YgbK (DUF1537 family)
MKLGCIGDDFTGSSDLANTLAKGGMRTVQYSGIPNENAQDWVEAGVVSLKSRSIDPKEAVAQSLQALEWLKAQGCTQFFFKYCSTFDSTPQGNIGPVADALAEALDAHKVIVCPAFPGTGRSIYQGHLFVKDKLLNQSGMENHPLTPMTDADIRRWLSHQTKFDVGHVDISTVQSGPPAIKQKLNDAHKSDQRLIVVDAIVDDDLMAIGKAASNLPLITGGSGVALGLPANFGCSPARPLWRGQQGKVAALSGSCSIATREQIKLHKDVAPSFEINARDVIEGTLNSEALVDWFLKSEGIPLAYSSADPNVVKAIQEEFGLKKSSETLEAFFADVARGLVANGVARIITAGGETSGAVVEALEITQLVIGPEIAPGVPALRANDDLVLALKSGNFGQPDFFQQADKILSE